MRKRKRLSETFVLHTQKQMFNNKKKTLKIIILGVIHFMFSSL